MLAWKKSIKHYGHTTTSRVKGGHATIKKWIAISTGNLPVVYKKLLLAWQQQQETFSYQVVYDQFNDFIYLL